MSSVATITAATGAYGAIQAGKGVGGNDRLIREQMQQNQANAKPYMDAGSSAENQLLLQMGLGGSGKAFDVSTLPGYQQSLKMGIDSTNQGLASQGLIGSGNQMRALQTAGQNVFGSYYQNYMNQLNGMTTLGANAGQGVATTNSGLANTDYQVQNQNALDSKALQLSGIKDLAGAGGSVLGQMMAPQGYNGSSQQLQDQTDQSMAEYNRLYPGGSSGSSSTQFSVF